MSRGFVKEGDQEDVPMVPPRAYLPKGMPNYVTHEGLETLKKELEDLENERVAASGNYIMSNFVDAKMKLLVERINTAVEVDVSRADKETVSFGVYVKYNGRTVRIVGVDEADFSKGLLSFISPVAKALVGKRSGDKFELKVPKGTETIEIQGVWHEPQPLTESGVETHSKQTISINSKKTPRTQIIPESVKKDASTVAGKTTDVGFVPENNIMEFLPVVNERGIIVGRALYMELHNGNKILHPSVHLHVVNDNGDTVRKYWWHVSFGDTPEKTLMKKMSETLGISGVKPKMKRQYIRETKSEKELVFVYNLYSGKNLPETPEEKEYLDVFSKD